jgi:hypothetical protein
LAELRPPRLEVPDAAERGAGPGEGFNVNLPLPLGTGDEAYLAALEIALDAVRGFAPGALVVALGLDAFAGDPLRGMALDTACFARIGAALARLDLPTVLQSVGSGAAGSRSLSNLGPRIMNINFDPGFFVEHFIKDMGIALEESRRMGLCLPGLALAALITSAMVLKGESAFTTSMAGSLTRPAMGVTLSKPRGAASCTSKSDTKTLA